MGLKCNDGKDADFGTNGSGDAAEIGSSLRGVPWVVHNVVGMVAVRADPAALRFRGG